MDVSEIVLYVALVLTVLSGALAVLLGKRWLIAASGIFLFCALFVSGIVLQVVDQPRFERECEARGGVVVEEGISCYKAPIERIDIP